MDSEHNKNESGKTQKNVAYTLHYIRHATWFSFGFTPDRNVASRYWCLCLIRIFVILLPTFVFGFPLNTTTQKYLMVVWRKFIVLNSIYMMNLSFVDRGKTVVKAKLHNKFFWANLAPKYVFMPLVFNLVQAKATGMCIALLQPISAA